MRGKKAKALRRLIKHFGCMEDTLMGDNRTARYYWRVNAKDRFGITHTRVIKSESDTQPTEVAVPLTATYTLTRHPGSCRRIYQRAKRRASHG